MSGKPFKIYQDSIRKFESDRIWGVKSETDSLKPFMTFKEAEKCCELLNSLQEENKQLRTQLLICQQSKNDDGRFKVWQIPPIPKGMKITITTSGDKDEI